MASQAVALRGRRLDTASSSLAAQALLYWLCRCIMASAISFWPFVIPLKIVRAIDMVAKQ